MAGSGKPFIVKVSPARSRKFLGFSPFRLVRQPNKTRLPIPHFGGFWYITGMAVPEPNRRWFHPTPGHLLLVLLAIEAILFFSERWILKGWSVLIAVTAVGVFLIGMVLWFALALVFRWRFQFSVRSLLLLTVAVAIPFLWLAVEMKKAKEQRETWVAIQHAGGGIIFDFETMAKNPFETNHRRIQNGY